MFSKEIPAEDRLFFYEEIGNRLAEGIALGRALEGFWETQSNFGATGSRWFRLVKRWADTLNGEIGHDGRSMTLSELASGYFPSVECAFIHIAETEQADSVEKGFKAAAAYAAQMEEHQAARQSVFANVVPWAAMTWVLTASTYYSQTRIGESLGIVLNYSPLQENLFLYLKAATYGFWPVALVAIAVKFASYWVLPNWCSGRRRWCDRAVPGFIGYAQYQGLAVLAGLAFMMSAGKSPAHGFDALRITASPWLRAYLDDLHDFCTDQKNDLVEALKDIGGHVPTPEMVRRLDEANKSPNFADRAVEVLKREIGKTARAVIRRLKDTNDQAMWMTSILSLLAVLIDFLLQSAVDTTY